MTENDADCIKKGGAHVLVRRRWALGPFQSAGAVLLGTLGFDDHVVVSHVADGLGVKRYCNHQSGIAIRAYK